MKKFLKVSIIVVLVVAVILGTCYFFFSRYKRKSNTTPSIVDMLQSEAVVKFKDDLAQVNSVITNSEAADTRIALVIEANNKLDQIIYTLSSYYISSNTQITNADIAHSLNAIVSSRNLLNRMMQEYMLKKESASFNKHVGANDLYVQACSYLVQSARFANLINQSLVINKEADVRFAMFEIYCNVVINTYSSSNLVTLNRRIMVNDYSNMAKMNSLLNIENLNLINNQYSIDNNNFIKYYNICAKDVFAKTLATNIQNVSDAEQDTNEKIATYYFKQIYGI